MVSTPTSSRIRHQSTNPLAILEIFFFGIPITSKAISKNRLQIDFPNLIGETRGLKDSSSVARFHSGFVSSSLILWNRSSLSLWVR